MGPTHSSAPLVELTVFLKSLNQGAVRAQVDARPWAGAAPEDRDGRRRLPRGSVAELTLQSKFDKCAERLSTLAGAALDGGENLVGDGDRGAHHARCSAS